MIFGGGSSSYEVVKKQFNTFIRLLEVLGIPTRKKKCHGPAKIQKILGFMHDTALWIMYVPKEKAIFISNEAIRLSLQRKVFYCK